MHPMSKQTELPEADALEKKAWLYGKMSDDLRAQAAQMRHPMKNSAFPVSESASV